MLCRRLSFVLLASVMAACTLLTDLNGLDSAAGQDGGPAQSEAGDGTRGDEGGVSSPPELTDQGEAGFARGQYLDTRWDIDHVALVAGKSSGDYVSRIVDLGASRKLARLEWRPAAPYAKPLPDDGRAETGYARGSVDMREAAMVLHFDGTAADFSGHATVVSGPPGQVATFAPARFGDGFADTTATWLFGTMDAQSLLTTGTSDFTWSLWVSSTHDCAQNIVYLGGEDLNDVRPHLWLGCAASFAECPAKDGTGRVAGTLATTQGDTKGWCGTRRIDDGKWHHLALVKSGHPTATIKVFVDGTIETAFSMTFGGAFTYDKPSELAIGAFSRGLAVYQASGVFDDVAVLRRALADQEVAALAARGALRLSFQVRACATATCTDNPPFVGPGSDGARSFLDVGASPPARADLSAVAPTQWLQYRAHFESDDPTASPELYAAGIVTGP